MSAVEKYYSVAEVALLLSCSEKNVVRKMSEGAFGDGCVNIGSEKRPDYRIPASGVNGYLQTRRVFSESSELGVKARSVGELRRKVKNPARTGQPV
jgi:hypothetical protein